jgi:hypothetical protein
MPKFKNVHRCKTPSLFMRRPGSKWTCKGEDGCGAGWTVAVSKRTTILGRDNETRYWLQTRG